jgi:S-adenosylmethionine/arginine decarboxylase-like enzyme
MNNSTRGLHFILTGFVSDEFLPSLSETAPISKLLSDVVALVEMKPLMEPMVLSIPLDESKADCDDDCGGVTGFVILGTSHTSIHTWPLHKRVSFDIYSCHTFDAFKVLEFLVSRVGLTGGEVVVVDRTPNPELTEMFDLILIRGNKNPLDGII